MSIKLSKETSNKLDRLRQLNVVLEFDREYGPDEKDFAEYDQTSAEMSELFEPLITRLCQAGLIHLHAFIGDIVKEPNPENYMGIEGCPKWADAEKDCETEGKISLYLNQDCASYIRNRFQSVPVAKPISEEKKEAEKVTNGEHIINRMD